MKHALSHGEYQRELKQNIKKLDAILCGEDERFPSLRKRLCSRNCAMGKRLRWLLSYASTYGEKEGQFISRDEERGFEAACSYETMVRTCGGSCDTWHRHIHFLCALGLMYQHKPDHHRIEANTPAQQYSLIRARDKTLKKRQQYKAVTWYSFPRYADTILSEAEARAEKLANTSNGAISKDAIRDVLGRKLANVSADTLYEMNRITGELRSLFVDVVRSSIAEKGYTTPDEVKSEAFKRLFDGQEAAGSIEALVDDMDEARRAKREIDRVWRQYRDTMLDKEGLKYSRPSEEERSILKLVGKNWIIRAK